MSDAGQFKGQLARFAVVGGLAVAIDAALYFLFVWSELMDPTWSKRASFGLGAVWAFFANKFFTFRAPGFKVQQPFLFAAVYLGGWALNSFIHDAVLHLWPRPVVAFLSATSVSTVTNFVGQKWLVFRSSQRASP